MLPEQPGPGPGRPTLVARLLEHPASVAVMSVLPVPLAVARLWLGHDNAREVARDDWARLADAAEHPRYAGVRDAVARYAPAGDDGGFVLDVGCSRGLLLDGLAYGRYLGIDRSATAVGLAQQRWGDARTRFEVADAVTFTPPAAPDAVVVNEVIYYLPDPRSVALRYAGTLAPGGVFVLSVFAHAWASRRLLHQLGFELELVETTLVESGHLAWTVAVFRRRPSGAPGEPSAPGYRP